LSDGMSDGFWDGKDRTIDLMESWKVDCFSRRSN
jgi:hypothetical protein